MELPEVKIGDKLDLIELNSTEKATEPPNRYSEAGLVKELEARGIDALQHMRPYENT